MPLYLIKIYRSGNPWQHCLRRYEAPDRNFAESRARQALAYARDFTETGRGYDSWTVYLPNPGGGKPIPIASGKTQRS